MKEKWYDRIYGQVPEEELPELEDALLTITPEDLREEEKSEQEIENIEIALAAYKKFSVESGLKVRDFKLANIHIINSKNYEEYLEKYKRNTPGREIGGHYHWGQVYLRRKEPFNKLDFLTRLTHELAHASSYNALLAENSESEKKGSIIFKRSGFNTDTKKLGEVFRGYNEGTTELFATHVRHEIIELSEAEQKKILKDRSYDSQLKLISQLVARVSFVKKISLASALKLLYTDYLNGTFNFLREIEKMDKGGAKKLMEMGITREDGVEAAKFFDITITYVKDDENID